MHLFVAEVTDKLQQFIEGVPGQLRNAADVIDAQINGTFGFVKYMEETLKGIVGNVTTQLDALQLTNIDSSAPTFTLTLHDE